MAKIKKDTSLRKAILQAAITGQLISNVDGETETGKQLLDRIIEERNKKLLAEWEEKLKETPKTKKPTQIVASEIDDEEIPLEIPESWCWCRLGEIIDLLSGRDLEPSEYNSLSKGIPYMTGASNFENEKLIINRWTDKPTTISRLGDLLITCKGTIGELAINHVGDIHIARQIMAIQNTDFISLSFLKFFLISRVDKIQRQAKSMIPGISREDMLGFLFPLPPLAVQNAIVAKLEEVLPFVDAYENVVLQKEELKTALPDKVKKAILQEAIQGKLTEDWRIEMLKQVQHDGRTEETDKQLLDRIIEERNAKLLAEWEEKLKDNPKAKKPTLIVASEIEEEEIPFEVPDSWCWCRLGEIGDVIMGQSPDGNAVKESGDGIEFHQGKIFFGDDYLKKSNQITTESTKIVGSDTILLCVRAPVGKVNLLDRDICIGRGLCALRPVISKKFVYYILQALESEFNDKATGTTFKAISKDIIFEQLLPLPPLVEQEKIVEIIDQMLPLCEKLGG